MLAYFFSGLKKFINLGKKIFLVIAVFTAVISIFFYFIGKDKALIRQKEDPITKNRNEIYKIVKDPQLNKTKEGKMAIGLYKMTMCGLIGEACTNNPNDGDKNFSKSFFGKIAGLISMPYANPPASGTLWVYDGLQSAGFVPKSYAAEGLGFATIKPYANLWKIFRDVAYLVLVLILIAIGFMIMFRMKLNPQTVITVENAIPRIVVALILITFSFAIAGFLIDLMYILIVLIISLLSNNNTYYNASQFQNEFITAGGSHLFKDAVARGPWWDVMANLGGAIIGIVPVEVQTGIKIVVGFLTAFIFNGLLQNHITGPLTTALNDILVGVATFNFSFGNIPGGVLGLILSPFFTLIFFTLGTWVFFPLIVIGLLYGTVLFLVLRLFFLLLFSYLKLLFLVIIAPIFLIFEALPGRSTFSSWIKNIIGNLLPFPVIIMVFLISFIIINTSLPTGTYDIRFPYLYGIDGNSFKIFIGMGLIFMIPDLIKSAKEALGIKDLPIGLNIGTFFGGAGAVGGGAMGLLGQFSTASLGLTGIGTLKKMLTPKKGETTPTPSDTAGSEQQARTAGQSQAQPITEGLVKE